MMGEKTTVRQTMKKAKVPILPGSEGRDRGRRRCAGVGEECWVSVNFEGWSRVAAGAGCGSASMRQEVPGLFQQASSEAAGAFGNGDMYMEKFIEQTVGTSSSRYWPMSMAMC